MRQVKNSNNHKSNNFIDSSNLSNIPDNQIIQRVVDFYHDTLKNNPDVLKVISSKYNISADEINTLKIGYSDGSMIKLIPSGEMRKKFKQLNITVVDKEYFREYITFPVIDENNIIRDIIGYNISVRKNRKEKIRYLNKNNPYVKIETPDIMNIIKTVSQIRTREIKDIIFKDDIYFQYGVRTYRIRGLNIYNNSKLKVNIQVKADKVKYIDTIDLYTARSRKGYINKTVEMFEAEYETIEYEISDIMDKLDEIRKAKQEDEERPRTKAVELSREEKEESLRILKNENLIEMIKKDLTDIGIAGEEKNKIMLYMVYTSRKLKKPMSVIIKGESAGGKSYLAGKVLKLFPPEEVKNFTEISAKSLFYMGEEELRHKILVIFERHGSRTSDYSIRSLQSEEKLQIAVTMKDVKSGNFVTREKEVRGPIAYVETSTELSIHPENETRMFDLYIDESAEQTRRIYEIQDLEYLPERKVTEEQLKGIVRKHRNMQRMLKAVKVKIPYVREIRFPDNRLRLRRDRMRFLALIESITFINQYQREREEINGEEYIISETEDYRQAYEIAEKIMEETLSVLQPKSRELLDIIKGIGRRNIRIRAIVEASGWNSQKVRRYIKQLKEEEYVEQINGGQGKAGEYRICERADKGKTRIEGLPAPEELEKKYRKRTKTISSPAKSA